MTRGKNKVLYFNWVYNFNKREDNSLQFILQ